MLDNMLDKSIPYISINKLDSLLKQNPKLVLLDVREPREFKVSHLKHARCVGYNHFDIKLLPQISQQDTIIVYCSIGYRSEKIGEELKLAGFKNVYNLYGGIFEWVNNGNLIENNQDDTTKKIHAYDKNWGKWLKNGDKVYD